MKLAFSGEARYPDFDDGYSLYKERSRGRENLDKNTYKKVVREFCKIMKDRLEDEGMVDFPNDLGSIAAINIKRKWKFFGDKLIGLGKKDWKSGNYDGSRYAFGVAFLPNRRKNENLRCYGFVANRKLFKRLKELYDDDCRWVPLELNDDMI